MGAKKTPRDAGIGGLLVIVGLLLFLGVVVQASAGH